ncbi:hypothetical protein F5Y04DRAFT_245391 [Hypomontagnella monticulosa]|nr:hypothetical protein F5Y04DRAFT_245391 [Hypomontagnella monticulosa]
MAASATSSEPFPTSRDTYETALCVIPPKHLWPVIDNLRRVYDSAYKKWPPHINLVYPFVPIQDLQRASEAIISKLHKLDGADQIDIQLDTADCFPNQKRSVFYIHDQELRPGPVLTDLREVILESLGRVSDGTQLHLTVGQGKVDSPLHEHTWQKAKTVPALCWKVDKLCILVRDRAKSRIDPSLSSQMSAWGEIDLVSLTVPTVWDPNRFYQIERIGEIPDAVPEGRPLNRLPYTFSITEDKWVPQQTDQSMKEKIIAPESLTIANYNIQAECEYPPTRARYPLIIQNLLHTLAEADVLVLEEVTDDFLSHLCRDKRIRECYPFILNGPPDQADIGPLPNYENIVVLSKWSFSWDLLSLPANPKGSVIVRFDDIGKHDGEAFLPMILSAVHLTSGLSNDAVQKKDQELKCILRFLSTTYPENPWILAGDFGIPTSVYTIEKAVKRGDISEDSRDILANIERMFIDAGLVDAWSSARVRDQLSGPIDFWHGSFKYISSPEYEYNPHDTSKAAGGEQDSTFDPIVNSLAADRVERGSERRPQRYDRILVRGQDFFTIKGFNMFGRDQESLENGKLSYGSDHWGIRCSLSLPTSASVQPHESGVIPIEAVRAPPPLADTFGMTECLFKQFMFPFEDYAIGETVFNLLKKIITQDEAGHIHNLSPIIMVPVGSYGLGAWTSKEDINCLCIGSISSKTFFSLAIQRLRRATQKGIKILRPVDEQSNATLELEVGNIRMVLHYCSAYTVVGTWPAILTAPRSDPMFELSRDTLLQLKPFRDLCYIRRTVPDLAIFRIAYQFIKCWAKRRGVYGAKFGYLDDSLISILLLQVFKLLRHEGGFISAPTLVTTFFYYYADFDWREDAVLDPFFHDDLSYIRSTREPMAVLGFHGPRLNAAEAVTDSTLNAISWELRRAKTLLTLSNITWSMFIEEPEYGAEFMAAYPSYVKITVRFWGLSLAKSNHFMTWLESQYPPFLKDLRKRVAHMDVRFWPGRWVNEDMTVEEDVYQRFYLIGLDIKDSQGREVPFTELQAAWDEVQEGLTEFEAKIAKDEHFDHKASYMSAEISPWYDITKLKLDPLDWRLHTLEAEDEDLGDKEFWAAMETEDSGSSSRKSEASTSQQTKLIYKGKFRSAADVLNRLRWDQAIDSSDYIVGYEDRFSGIMERSVDSWKSETTHEEFIPEHRIMYFKRKSDSAIVWDRKERRDEIFGSGVTSLKRQA